MSGCPLKTLFQHILRDFSCFYQLDHILWTYLLLTTYQDYLLSICKYFISSLFDMATKPVLSFWLILKTLRFRAVYIQRIHFIFILMKEPIHIGFMGLL